MAGGMGRGLGIPLRDRTRPGEEPVKRPPVRQCWLFAPKESSAVGPWPALILEWKRAESGWIALVVYVVTEEAYPTAIQTWVDAGHLRPVSEPTPAPPP